MDDYVRDFAESLFRRPNKRGRLVVVLTTSGGYIEVVQRIVETLRHHYGSVLFVVPNYAYSAGTVLAMSGNEIHMDYYSRLGPIDPQVSSDSGKFVPALGYLAQWERLLQKARDGKLTQVEMQLMIQGFDQGELYAYEQARDLSIALLKDWLVRYKFATWIKTETTKKTVTAKMRSARAVRIARILNDTEKWHSHGYGISREVLQRDVGLRIDDLDVNPARCAKVRAYHGLADDYMRKIRANGTLHIVGAHMAFSMN